MNDSQSTISGLIFISWAFITVVLVVLLSYRATLSQDDDQNSLHAADVDCYQRKQTIIARRSLLMGEIIVLSVISGVLLLTCAGCSIYWGLNNL